MADQKISQLTPATTPLAGTEVLPIVQSSATVKVAVSDLTAGRAISATAATLSSGNLTFSSTAQRITGDFSNATAANSVIFQSNVTNGGTIVRAIPNGTSNFVRYQFFNNAADLSNTSNGDIGLTSTEMQVRSGIAGTGTYLPMTFYTGGSERVRIDTSGNVGIGTASALQRLTAVNTAITGGAPASSGSAADPNAVARLQAGAVALDFGVYAAGQMWLQPRAASNYATNYDLVLQPNGGNVGIGTASPSQLVEASLSQNGKTQVKVTNVNAGANTSAGVLFGTSSGDNGYIGANGGAAASALGGANAVQVTNLTANPVVLATNNTERMRIDSSGSVGIGGTSFGSGTLVMFIANATAVPSTNPTGGGVLYVEGGALKYRGSSGTVTTIANA
jgi:hypothetical protein